MINRITLTSFPKFSTKMGVNCALSFLSISVFSSFDLREAEVMRILSLLFLYSKSSEKKKNHLVHGNNGIILSSLGVVENHAVLLGFFVRSARSTPHPFSP